jgi:hypothetical protein
MRPCYRKLRNEIENMLSILGEGWELEESIVLYPTVKVAAVVRPDNTAVLAEGCGATKAEALADLIRRWARGKSVPYAPAAGSAAELRLKLAVAEG